MKKWINHEKKNKYIKIFFMQLLKDYGRIFRLIKFNEKIIALFNWIRIRTIYTYEILNETSAEKLNIITSL